MKKLSLRIRLIIYFMAISCIIWLIAGFVSWKETRDKIDEFFDTYQMVLARQLATADWENLIPNSQKITNATIKNIHNAEDEDEAIGFAVFDANGKMVFHDDENGKNFKFDAVIGGFVNQKIEDDETWRFVRLKSADNNYTITVGQELEYRNDVAWDMVEEFIMPWVAGLFVLLVMIVAIISRELWPLKTLSENLNNRLSGDVSPLSKEGIPQEVTPLIEAMNRLLKQVESMIRRERSFIADSAHELRTPLTALKIQLEVAQMCGDDEKTRNEALDKLQQGIERAARLVEQLLALSKVETTLSSSQVNNAIVDWEKVVKEVVGEYERDARDKNILVSCDVCGSGPVIEGNQLLCSLMLRNLLDNAIKYSPMAAKVNILVKNGCLEVINSDTKIDEQNIIHLNERFFRPSGQSVSGSGLGLSIVESIAKVYKCNMSFGNISTGFRVVVQHIS